MFNHENLLSVTLKSCVSPTYLEVDFTNLYPFPLETKEAGTDNRNIVDDGKSQKLTHDDIKALKDKGIKGQVKIRFWCHFCATLMDGFILVSEKGYSFYLCIDFSAFSLFIWSSLFFFGFTKMLKLFSEKTLCKVGNFVKGE